jgi:hypothetical protein
MLLPFVVMDVGDLFAGCFHGSLAGKIPTAIMASLYRKSPKFHGKIYCRIWEKYGPYPGVETLDILDVVDAVDANDVPQGLGRYEWRRLRQLRRVGWWFVAGSAGDWGLAMDAMN